MEKFGVLLPILVVMGEAGSGKKGPQRQVPYEQYEANWDLAFGKRQDKDLKDWTPDPNSRIN